ncbi:hypothetical protein ACFYNO_31690 [Kitasatospora sp. NPDC006697]|uniref:hypothetical protein n=1 Tax=Kitasatospora sp. NPDC006697 TaxID=3364020 RepID=UPI0036A4417E
MSNPDALLVEIASMVESEHSNQMPLTVVVPGAVITGRLAPQSLWHERVAEVLTASDHLKPFAALFSNPAAEDAEDADDTGDTGDTGDGSSHPGRPTHLHLHVARILQGSYALPHTGGMYRIAIADISSWTVGDLSYTDQ